MDSGLLGVDRLPRPIIHATSVPPSLVLYLPGVGRDADNKDAFSACEKGMLCRGKGRKFQDPEICTVPSSLQSNTLSEGLVEIFGNHSPALTRIRVRFEDAEQSKINSFQANYPTGLTKPISQHCPSTSW